MDARVDLDISKLKSIIDFDQLINENLLTLIQDGNLQDDKTINEVMDALTVFDKKVYELIDQAKKGNSDSVAATITKLRNNNLLMKLYQRIYSQENSNTTSAANIFEQSYTIWNNFLCEAAIAGYKKSKHAKNEISWWRLATSMPDDELAVALLEVYISDMQTDAAKIENYKSIQVGSCPDKAIENELSAIPYITLSETDEIVIYQQENKRKLEAEFQAVLNAVENENNFHAVTGAIDALRTQGNIEFKLLMTVTLDFMRAKFHEHKQETQQFKQTLSRKQIIPRLRYFLMCQSYEYCEQAAASICPLIKNNHDLRKYIQAIEDPRLLAAVMRGYQPEITLTPVRISQLQAGKFAQKQKISDEESIERTATASKIM